MAKTECLIIAPGINSVANWKKLTVHYEFPRGALSVGSFLEAKGCSVVVMPLDYYLKPSQSQNDIDAQIHNIVQAAIQEYKPSVVGVSVPYTIFYHTSLKILESCKDVNSNIITMIGGPHVSFLDRETFEDTQAVDIVVRGEGEWTALNILNAVAVNKSLSAIEGITYRENGVIHVNPDRPPGDLNTFPRINYGVLPDEFVKNMALSIITSRGCRFKCNYCNESIFWGNKVRRIPVADVVAEFNQLANNYNNYPTGIEDSMFDMRSSYFFELCSEMSKIRLSPEFYLFSRVDSVTDEGLDAMVDAGIKHIFMGIESASPKVQQFMNKGITVDQAHSACKMASGKGIKVSTFWMIGHPGDNPTEADITINTMDSFFKEGIIHQAEIAIFIPYPGSVFFRKPEEYGITILHKNWERWGRFFSEPVIELEEFPQKEIFAAWEKAKSIDKKYTNRYG